MALATTTSLALALFTASALAAPPEIPSTTFSKAGTESVRLEAEINPQGNQTQYHFEYGLADCSSSPCTSAPVPSGKIPAGSSPVHVSVEVEGLDPGTTYHFRVVANSTGGTAKGPDETFTTHTLPPSFGPCANDAFRTSQPSAILPDCRAYEQASPIAKAGLDARSTVALAKASVNGDRVSFAPAGGMPGGEGAQELPMYLSSRSGGEWSTQGLLPPASSGEEAFVLGWTPDFAWVFDAARKFGGTAGSSLLARASADGSLSTIVAGGLQNPFFAASSADGSEVLFESTSALAGAPASLEGKSNLYLWDRDSGQVSLAGVLNDKAAPPAGAFAGPYDWIGKNSGAVSSGGAAAGYYTQDEGAISADGSRAYFTAAKSGQLYLRLNPGKEQSPLDGEGKCSDPELACTLRVSASQRSVPDPAGARGAAFMGATPDGAHAFFTSSEKLTDDANTGPEVPPPAIARAGIEGSAKNLSFLPAKAKGVAVDGTYIYWANPEDGTIGRAKLDGSNPELEFITDTESECEGKALAGKPQYVAVDGGHLYWTSAPSQQAGCGVIGRAELSGADPEAEFIKGATNPQGIAADPTYFYWSNAGTKDETRTIGRAELSGGEAKQKFIEVGEGGQELTPQGLVVNGTHIYIGINGTGQNSYVFRFDINGTNRQFLFDEKGSNVKGIALDSTYLYWAREAANAIGREKLADFPKEELSEKEFIKEAGHPRGLAVNATHVLWSANQEAPSNPGNDLYRYDAVTGKLSDLAPDSEDADGAEVVGVLGASEDGKSVYFVANGDLDGKGEASEGDCAGTIDTFINFSGECNLYLAREGKPLTFLARLDAGEGTASDATNWLPNSSQGSLLQRTARVSANGSTLLFRSQQQLTPYENEGTSELYRYRVGEAGFICVSCNPSGEAPSGLPKFGSIRLSALFPAEWSSTLSRNLSADGDRVFFETTDALVGEDTNGAGGCPLVGPAQGKYRICLDAYEWEAAGSGSCPAGALGGGCIYLLSTGKSPDASYIFDASASGDDVFFATRSPLVRQDQDQLYDVYDAHVDGGLAGQNQVSLPCEGLDSCHPDQGPPPPAFESPPTASFAGPANPKPKGAHKKHRKHRKRAKHKHHRRASHKSGRAGR
jgi:hypothetical protein